jgi:hypothetical protein
MLVYFETGDNWARLRVKREDNDPKFYNESRLWYAIKNELNANGFDMIKTNPGKDRHLFSSDHYLRTRSHRSKSPHIYVYDGKYAIRMMYTEYNEGKLTLDVALDVYDKQADCIERIERLKERMK